MSGLLIGYARVSTDEQDLTAQRDALTALGVASREGMKVARVKGRLRGKKPKLSPRQEPHLVERHHAGAHTSAELAELFSVARSTVYPSTPSSCPS